MIGPFWPWGSGNMAPYTDFHALNTDWIIKIAKDFIDQYTTIQQQITDKTSEGLEALDAEATRLEGLLNDWYTQHSEDIASQLTTAIADFQAAATAAGAEVIASIPEDYTALSDNVGNLKNSFEGIDCIDTTGFISGSITNGGSVGTSNSMIRSAAPIPVTQGMFLQVDATYEVGVAIYNAAGFTTANFSRFLSGSSSDWESGEILIPNTYIGKYIGIRIRKVGHTSDDISGDVATIENYVKLYNPSTVVTKALFPNYFEDRAKQFLKLKTPSAFWWTFGKTILSNGNEGNSVRAAHTGIVPVTPYSTIINYTPATDSSDRVVNVYVAEYANNVFSKRTQLLSGAAYTTSPTTTQVAFVVTYTDADSVTMTTARLMDVFQIGIEGNPASGDGMIYPYYAVGASTTVGAVHHFTGESVTYTPFMYPNYIGQVAGAATFNLGEGTTGFIARNNGTQPNFMDVIYNNISDIAEGGLISLVFGYGNDQVAGLPFGEWDDYFPYDSVEEFYVEGETADNDAGVTAMLAAGATLTGCLNWCIKYLGENAPKTQLVLIFGAPSVNADYSVSVVENTGSGDAPYKIQVADRTNANAVVINTLREKLNIPILNMWTDGMPFSYYQSMATNPDGTYAIFSTKGTADHPVWNSHPNEIGYLMYARYMAGQILQYYKN